MRPERPFAERWAEPCSNAKGAEIHATRCVRGSMGSWVCSRVVRVAEVGERTSDSKKRGRLTSLIRRGPFGWPGISARGSRAVPQGIAPGLRVKGRRESVREGLAPFAQSDEAPRRGLAGGRHPGSWQAPFASRRAGWKRSRRRLARPVREDESQSPTGRNEGARQRCQRVDRSAPRGRTIHGGNRAIHRSGRGVVKRQVPWARQSHRWISARGPQKGTGDVVESGHPQGWQRTRNPRGAGAREKKGTFREVDVDRTHLCVGTRKRPGASRKEAVAG